MGRKEGNPTHGLINIYKSEYNAWGHLKDRCNNIKNAAYENYGGRGIRVCKCIDNFSDFINYVGKRPSKKHSIDRKENDGDYCGCKNNIRWSIKKVQNLNQRPHKKKSTLPRGVYIDRNSICSRIRVDEKTYSLGYFGTVEEAHQEFLTYYFLEHNSYPPEYY